VFDISMDYYRDVGCNMELTIPLDFANYSEHVCGLSTIVV
jgi:hypothetical protein